MKKALPHWLAAFAVFALMFVLSSVPAMATAQTNIVALLTDAEDTFDAIVPVAMTIAGLLILWPIGRRILKSLMR